MLVLEIGHIVAGPTVGLILSDFGFEVIKIEKPGTGDIARTLGGQSVGSFPFYNRNKKSLTLDLKTEKGREIFKKLVKNADIVVDNLGYGAMIKLNLGYEHLRKINKKLIYLSLKGYGEGPYLTRKSLDYPIEVHSGLAYMTGLMNKPMRLGASIVDMGTALFGVIGILDALMEREHSGEGKYIDCGLFETALFFMGQHIATAQLISAPLKPINEIGFAWGIYDFFETLDNKKIFIAVTTDTQWKKFCVGFSLNLCKNEEFATNTNRFNKRDILIPHIAQIIKTYTLKDVIAKLDKLNVAYAVFNTPRDLLDDPHAQKKMIGEKYNNIEIKVPYTPIKHTYLKDPPKLGEDTVDILLALGYTKKDIIKFSDENII